MKIECLSFNGAQTETCPMAPGGAALRQGDLNPSFLWGYPPPQPGELGTSL